MKAFLKIFGITTTIATIAMILTVSCVMNSYNQFKNEAVSTTEPEHQYLESDDQEDLDPYRAMIKRSKRINLLVIGVAEYNLADTLMLISYDPKLRRYDLISIPRDTYYEREGYTNRNDLKKINAAHGVKENKVQSTMNAVSNLLDIPIHNYVRLDYEVVAKMVDAVDGITVDIKKPMYYRDDMDTPPLLINFPAGTTTLDGENAVKYLRYRNDKEADLGRIKRHQDFVNKFIKKAMGLNLIKISNIAKEHLDTNVDFTEALRYAKDFVIDTSDLGNMRTIPATPEKIKGIDFLIPDSQGIKKLIEEIYLQ